VLWSAPLQIGILPIMNTTVLALALALAPQSPQSRTSFDVSDAELETGDNSAHLLAYDSDGEVSAEIIVWVDSNDQPRLDVVFADGLYLSAVDGVIESDDAAEVAARVEAIDEYLADETTQLKASKLVCAGSFMLTVSACASLRVLACMGGSAVTACACLPAFSDSECWW
jgi:hypothetical protein